MPKMQEFLTKEVAGLPTWAWIAVVAAGIAAAYIVPKFLGSGSTSATSSDTSTAGSGLGLAIDPTTGLPYAVSGLVPSGANAGAVGQTGATGPQGPPGPTGPQGPTGTPPTKTIPPVGPVLSPVAGTPAPTANTAKYVTVTKWPTPLSTLSGIASRYGVSLQRIEQLNPQIKNPNLIYTGQQVRIA